jgi:hypothetical protein
MRWHVSVIFRTRHHKLTHLSQSTPKQERRRVPSCYHFAIDGTADVPDGGHEQVNPGGLNMIALAHSLLLHSVVGLRSSHKYTIQFHVKGVH